MLQTPSPLKRLMGNWQLFHLPLSGVFNNDTPLYFFWQRNTLFHNITISSFLKRNRDIWLMGMSYANVGLNMAVYLPSSEVYHIERRIYCFSQWNTVLHIVCSVSIPTVLCENFTGIQKTNRKGAWNITLVAQFFLWNIYIQFLFLIRNSKILNF